MEAFTEIVRHGRSGPLRWALPEGWLHAELYSYFVDRQEQMRWMPIAFEVPYFTSAPVHPRLGLQGGVKWADLCLHSPDLEEWCWFELKVRHSGQGVEKHLRLALLAMP